MMTTFGGFAVAGAPGPAAGSSAACVPPAAIQRHSHDRVSCRTARTPVSWITRGIESGRGEGEARALNLARPSHLRLNKQDLGSLDPSLAQVHTEPAVAVFRLKANGRARPELGQVILDPGLAQVGRKSDPR